MRDITTMQPGHTVADLYRHAVITKLAYERVRSRIQAISHILNHTKAPALWREPAKRAIRLGQKYRRRMTTARENARLAILYNSMDVLLSAKARAEMDTIVKTFEEKRRKALS